MPTESGRSRRLAACRAALVLCVVALVPTGRVPAQTGALEKAKQKAAVPGTGKAATRGDRVLLDLERDYLAPLEGADAGIAEGATVNVLLDTGKRYDGMEVTEWLLGKDDATLRTVAVKHPDKNAPQRFQASAITQIESSGRAFDVAFDASKKGYVLLDGARRDQVVSERLRPTGHRLWREYGDEEQAAFVEESKSFLRIVGEAFAQTPMFLNETRYFLFYTDMPRSQVAGYVAYLDAMYLELCKAFGVPRGKNIWRGKAVIVAFAQKPAFLVFEAKFMNNADAERSRGVHHGATDGRSITACWRGDDPAYFGHVLVHETSHGFMHRFRSTIHVPPWINEGVADWVAAAVVRNCPETERRQRDGLDEMKRTAHLGATFFAEQTHLERWQYGAASHLTSYLLSVDANRYRGLITGIKEGHSWDESLKLAYGWSPAELVRRYGASIGVANLQP